MRNSRRETPRPKLSPSGQSLARPAMRWGVLGVMLFGLLSLPTEGRTDEPTRLPPEAAPAEMFQFEEPVEMFRAEGAVPSAAAPAAAIGGPWVAQGPGPTLSGQVENIDLPGNNPVDPNPATPEKPVTGAVHAIVAHPTDPKTLYLGGVNGGVWRTTNATDANPHWTPLTDQFPSLSIGALELDPTDPTNQTLVAGNGRYSNFGAGDLLDGLLRTTDGGNFWTQLGQVDLAGNNISGIGARGTTILVAVNAGTGPGMYRSTDGGVSFPFISGINGLNTGPVFDVAGDPGNVMRFYAGVGGAGGGIFRTDDAGATWTNVTDAAIGALIGGTTNNIELAVSAAGTNPVYVGIVNNSQLAGVFRSANQGGVWTAMDLPQTLDRTTGITNATNATPIVITSASNHGLATTDRVRITGVTGNTAANGDFTITVIDPTRFSLNGSAGNGAYTGGGTSSVIQGIHHGMQGANNFAIAADPNDGNVVYVGGDRQDFFPSSIGARDFTGRLFRGDAIIPPGGPGAIPSPQWTPLTHNGTAANSSPHADSRDMAFDANGDLVEGDDGGIYRRISPQSTAGDWVSVIGDLQVTEFHDIAYDGNSAIIMGGAQDTGVPQQITPGGTTWNSVTTADGGDVAVDNLTLAGVNQSIRYSSNQLLGGFQRQVFDVKNTQIGASVPLFPGSLPGFVPQFVTPIELNAVAPPVGQSTRLVIGGRTNPGAMPPVLVGAVYEATNAGIAPNAAAVNWTQIPTGAGFGAVNPGAMAYGGRRGGVNNPDVLYGGSGNRVFIRTTAGGTLNATAALPTGGWLVRDIALDPNDWMTAYVIDSNQVFMTDDAGAHWTDITGNLTDGDLRSVVFVSGGDDAVFVGGRSGVFRMLTDNPGDWVEFGIGLPEALVYDLDYDEADDVLVAGTLGRGAWLLAGVVTCFGMTPTKIGTGGNDALIGTPGDDVIVGMGGDDVIDGKGGNDRLCGDEGNDTIRGGIGDDRIDGGPGNDGLHGNPGNDTILGDEGNDVITGDDGDDVIDGGLGDDRITGDPGNDTILGDEGNDVISGNAGNDRLDGGLGFDRLDGGLGTDTCIAGERLARCEFISP